MNIIKGCAYSALLLSLSACGDVTDLVQVSTNVKQPLSVGTCPDAKYLDDARCWDVQSMGGYYENVGRIELTASGNYLFLPRLSDIQFGDIYGEDEDYAYYAMDATRSVAGKSHSPFRKKKGVGTRAYNGGVHPVGNFRKVNDNEYVLENLGTLIVNPDGTLTLREGGTSYDFKAEAVSGYELDALTRRFSRSWELVQVERSYYDENGKFLRKRVLSQQEVEDEYVRVVIVSQFGTFMRYDWDGDDDDGGIWRWENTSNQIFQFAFDSDSDSDYDSGYDFGLEQVYFYNDYAMYLENGEYEGDFESGYMQVSDVLKTRSCDDFKF